MKPVFSRCNTSLNYFGPISNVSSFSAFQNCGNGFLASRVDREMEQATYRSLTLPDSTTLNSAVEELGETPDYKSKNKTE